GRDEHVPPGSVGHLLRYELAEHHRHATLHGLEGLAREALVGLAQAPPEGDHQARRYLSVFGHQPAHVRTEHGHPGRRLDRLHGGRAALVLEQRELAEDVARAEPRQRDRAPVAVRSNRSRATLAHDVAGVAGVALAEDHLIRLEPARNRELGNALQIGALERGEHGYATQQLDHVCCAKPSHGARDSPAQLGGRRGYLQRMGPTFRWIGGLLALVVLLPAPATSAASTAARARASAHSPLQSRQLWATIDLCNPPDQPHYVGVRGSMPGDGRAGDGMYMRF